MDERRRYSRNIMLPEIGEDGQHRLSSASVLIMGCGALGSVAAMYLAASGIGTIGLVDFDTIDVSNLQRQLSFTTGDVGYKKTEVLGQRLKSVNPGVEVKEYDVFLNPTSAARLIPQYDFIIEGSDNPDTKYMIDKVCRELGVPYTLGGIFGTVGQVFTWTQGNAGYADIFPEKVGEGGFTPCSLGGVLGPLPGIIASIQASETIKYIVGFGELLTNRVLLVNASSMNFTQITVNDY